MNPWIGVAGTLLGVVVGFGLNWWRDERRRKATRRALWTALECDLEKSRSNALGFLAATIDAPAYRLPTRAFDDLVPRLLEDGAMNEDEYAPLLDFFHVVDQANRGLDLAQAAVERGDTEQQNKEGRRVRMKMQSLVEGREGRPPLHPAAAAVVRRHLSR